MRDHKEVFEQIYRAERWGKGLGSGSGSSPVYSAKWLRLLHTRLGPEDSVLDVGCGDQQLYDGFHAPWGRYTGLDVSSTALRLAHARAPRQDLRWVSAMNATEVLNICRERGVTCVLMKDVLQHWEDEAIAQFMDAVCPTFRGRILVSNNWRHVRSPYKDGMTRELDRYEWSPIPLNFPALVRHGFVVTSFYPTGRFKAVMERPPCPT